MKFVNPLPFVADIARSKRFYSSVMGLAIVQDHGNFVQFDGGFALHDGAALHETIFGEKSDTPPPYGRKNLVLYFEVEDIETVFSHVSGQVELIHPVQRQLWGQRVFRFYDPDRHIIEIGEPQALAVCRNNRLDHRLKPD